MVEYNARVDEVAGAIMDRVREVLVEKKVDYTEYKAFLQWAREATETVDWRVFIDNFFEWTIELNTYKNVDGSEGTVEGPYFIPDASLLTEKPFVMPMRPNEPGVPMVLNGEVRRLNGEPISGAHIDLWQADDGGRYAGFDFAEPRFNLRARLHTNEQGRFQVRTIQPAPYQIPTSGPVGRFLEMIGSHAWRPAHFHLIVTAEGCQTLTTQLYFRGGDWVDGDVSNAVKDSLIVDVLEDKDEEVASWYGLTVPFRSVNYVFELRPTEA